ncbi:MAG: monomeric [FeFe] hydrogenase [Christensenellales bacterium]
MIEADMRIFDTNVQLLKYKTLKAVIKHIYADDLESIYLDVPKEIVPGPKATMRCCIYKERAIVGERVKLALGGDKNNPNIVEVIDIACDECPVDGIMVTPACRGCLTHQCKENCPKDAISIIDKRAVIDKEKCIECGKCVKSCPYGAIIAQHRPCVVSCKAKALKVNAESKKAEINVDKCINCGACVYACPFGAIVDKSFIVDCINLLRGSQDGKNYKVYAVIAPSIVSQFKYAKVEQVITGMKKLGFHQVIEAALGADVDLKLEADECIKKGVLLSSCCPAFVDYVIKNFPELESYISENVSPMVVTAKMIKASDPTAKVIFIGPCSAKKAEYKLPKTGGAIDCVMSFEELQAFLDARDINVSNLECSPLDNASYFGRIFAKSGGVAQGIKNEAAKAGKEISVCAMNGIDECRANLTRLKFKRATENFFEGMACEGGCINGALCLTHGVKNADDVDRYGNEAKEKTIENSVNLYEMALGKKKES